MEEIVSANKVLEILDSNVAEVESLCKRASLRPRRDELGNVYFSKNDIDVLKKVKELYEHTKLIQEIKRKKEATNVLTRAKARLKNDLMVRENKAELQAQFTSKIQESFDGLERNIVDKMEKLFSEKMDGLDEVVLELIRSKTENETLRSRLNELNKENFALKNEVSSYKPLGIGLYVKKPVEEF